MTANDFWSSNQTIKSVVCKHDKITSKQRE